MRVFYALTLTSDSKQSITPLRDSLANNAVKGRFTREENYHLTLEFIGNINHGELSEYIVILNSLGAAPESLVIEHYGAFKRRDREIIWLGIKKDKVLTLLQKQLRMLLKQNDMPNEQRKYTPHITIGRQVLMHGSIEDMMIKPIELKVHSIALMESKNVDGVLRYEPIEERVVQND